jgi:hypothetical protein
MEPGQGRGGPTSSRLSKREELLFLRILFISHIEAIQCESVITLKVEIGDRQFQLDSVS